MRNRGREKEKEKKRKNKTANDKLSCVLKEERKHKNYKQRK